MTNSKLCILTCCVGVGWATFVSAQTADNGSDDQERALQALRQAEAGPTTEQILAEKEAQKEAAKRKRQQDKENAAAAQAAPAVTGVSDDQIKALEALRQAEHGPIVPDQAAPVVSAPVVTTPPEAAPPPAAPPIALPEDQMKALEALRNAEAAPVVADHGAPPATEAAREAQMIAAERQREEDALRIKEAKEAKKAAAEQARAAKIQAEKAEKQARIAKAEAEKQREAAARANGGQSGANAYNAPQPPASVSSTAYTNAVSKEQKLADLLRRYQADEITPYEYHMERAKIVAEP